jgi:hypothetical protein
VIFGRVTVAYVIAAVSITTSAALVLYDRTVAGQCEQKQVATNVEIENFLKVEN